MLFIVTPTAGVKVVVPDPYSIKSTLYPIGRAIVEFAGTVRTIAEEVDKRIVFPTYVDVKLKLDVCSITVPMFAIYGSTSNRSNPEFQSRPVPANVE